MQLKRSFYVVCPRYVAHLFLAGITKQTRNGSYGTPVDSDLGIFSVNNNSFKNSSRYLELLFFESFFMPSTAKVIFTL